MPMPPTKGKKEEQLFLMYVGYCITTWADVEERLFQIFWKCAQCPKEQAAIIYYRTPTLDTRLSLTDELVKHVLPKPERKSGGHPHPNVKQWNGIESEFRGLLSTRRRIAHHPLKGTTLGGRGILSGWTWFELHVSEGEKLRGRSDALKPLRLADLEQHHIEVLGLASHLEAFQKNTLPKHAR